jgi:hypothetical protein
MVDTIKPESRMPEWAGGFTGICTQLLKPKERPQRNEVCEIGGAN